MKFSTLPLTRFYATHRLAHMMSEKSPAPPSVLSVVLFALGAHSHMFVFDFHFILVSFWLRLFISHFLMPSSAFVLRLHRYTCQAPLSQGRNGGTWRPCLGCRHDVIALGSGRSKEHQTTEREAWLALCHCVLHWFNVCVSKCLVVECWDDITEMTQRSEGSKEGCMCGRLLRRTELSDFLFQLHNQSIVVVAPVIGLVCCCTVVCTTSPATHQAIVAWRNKLHVTCGAVQANRSYCSMSWGPIRAKCLWIYK